MSEKSNFQASEKTKCVYCKGKGIVLKDGKSLVCACKGTERGYLSK